jgi:uncharacterized membrane protein
MVPRPGLRYFVLLLAVTAWLVLVFFPVLPDSSNWSVAPWILMFFSKICHQIPDRTFSWWGNHVAVCHRCLGLYIGFWTGVFLFPWLTSASRQLIRQPKWIVIFFLPLGVDVLVNNTVLSRFATGFLAGFPVALFVWLAVEQLPEKTWLPSRRSHESRSG